jgi:hypothetical protein
VRIRTRNGYDWSDRFPLITAAAELLSASSFTIDGEGVILNANGTSDFDRLHSRRHDGEVQLLGFDLLELDGVDLRIEPLDRRKAGLAGLLRGSRDGVQLVEHFDQADGAMVFAHACRLGLEGIVSKRRDMPYQHGRSRAWLKIRNPQHPATRREWEVSRGDRLNPAPLTDPRAAPAVATAAVASRRDRAIALRPVPASQDQVLAESPCPRLGRGSAQAPAPTTFDRVASARQRCSSFVTSAVPVVAAPSQIGAMRR